MTVTELDEDTLSLLSRLSGHTGISSNEIINRLLGSHLLELHELNAFLESHANNPATHDAGANLLVNYDTEGILTGLKRIAPHYELLNERFSRELKEALPNVRHKENHSDDTDNVITH